MHSYFSTDSSTPTEAMIQQAIQLGLQSVCLTEHNDMDYPLEDGKVVFQLDLERYIAELLLLKEKYHNQIDIRIGIEQGLQPHLGTRTATYASEYADTLDFIIGSTHLVDGYDPYYPDFWNSRTTSESIRKYFQCTLENMNACNHFDVYGHLDYIVRYAPDQDSNYHYSDYADILDVILTTLIQKGKGIELNTAGLKYGLKEAHPSLAILKRYKALGGEILTIGSDAHRPEDIAYGFNQIPAVLEQAGFRYYTIFQKRKAVFVPV